MTLTSSIALFLIMGTLAAIPSSSVLLVVTQSAAIGLRNGIVAAIGVVVGDLIFMTMAIFGMTALAEQMGILFILVRYLAGAYLIWFGIGLIRSHRSDSTRVRSGVRLSKLKSSLTASFGAGLLLTLGDIKAIFFYASLLPTFVDLASLTASDLLLVSGITVFAVGGVKVVYAFAAGKALHLSKGLPFERELKVTSGGFMICAGAYMLFQD